MNKIYFKDRYSDKYIVLKLEIGLNTKLSLVKYLAKLYVCIECRNKSVGAAALFGG